MLTPRNRLFYSSHFSRIRKIENLDGLTKLKQLYLGKNKIAKLENLDSLVELEILSIQSNRIVKVRNSTRLVLIWSSSFSLTPISSKIFGSFSKVKINPPGFELVTFRTTLYLCRVGFLSVF